MSAEIVSTTAFTNPVVVICPPGQSLSPSDLADVHLYYLTTPGTDTVALTTFPTAAVQVTAEVHKRGHSTLGAAKAQYAVHLAGDPSGGGHFLGMDHGGKHWVFNDAGVVDITMMRNVMAFAAQREMDQWAPRTKGFELFVAENQPAASDCYSTVLANVVADPAAYYRGYYVNTEKIRNEKHRIHINEYAPDTSPVGAVVIQLNPANPDEYEALNSFSNLPLTADVQIYEPKADYFTANPGQLEPIQLWYNNNATSGWGTNFALVFWKRPADDTWTQIRKTTDYPAFATYFLLNELARDPDGYHKSTFMYKTDDTDPAGSNPAATVFAGPLWDKNKSFGNTTLDYPQHYSSPKGWLYPMLDGGQAPVWWGVLLQDDEFCKEVWRQWTTHSAAGGILTSQRLVALLDDQLHYLTATGALARDHTVWPVPSPHTYEGQLSDLTSYIEQRLAWIESAPDHNLRTLLRQPG